MADHLELLADKFQAYRGSKSRARYPEFLWDEVVPLTQVYSIKKIATALNVNPNYLSRKLRLLASKVSFTQIHLLDKPDIQSVCFESCSSGGRLIKIHFQADCQEILSIIRDLIGQRS